MGDFAAMDAEWMRRLAKAPNQESLRLEYVDWLTRHGDPRGDFLALDSELHEAPPLMRNAPGSAGRRSRPTWVSG